jgi:predicted Rossmann fold nucleotide-binding protein DprA/Smf involved in DNA uptake
VFAVPHAPWDARGGGVIELLRQGAAICTSAADVLSLPASEAAQGSLPGLLAARESKDDAGLPDASRRVFEALRIHRQHADDLVVSLDMSVAEVHEALLILVLDGLIRQAADGTYARALD